MKLIDDTIDMLERHRGTGNTTKLISAMSAKDMLVVATNIHGYNLKHTYPSLDTITLKNPEKSLGKDGTLFFDNFAVLILLIEIRKHLQCKEEQITDLKNKMEQIRDILNPSK